MSKVSAKSRSLWDAAMNRDISNFLAEDSSENSDTAVKGIVDLLVVGATTEFAASGRAVERDC